jgi:hypothetical protein
VSGDSDEFDTSRDGLESYLKWLVLSRKDDNREHDIKNHPGSPSQRGAQESSTIKQLVGFDYSLKLNLVTRRSSCV